MYFVNFFILFSKVFFSLKLGKGNSDFSFSFQNRRRYFQSSLYLLCWTFWPLVNHWSCHRAMAVSSSWTGKPAGTDGGEFNTCSDDTRCNTVDDTRWPPWVQAAIKQVVHLDLVGASCRKMTGGVPTAFVHNLSLIKFHHLGVGTWCRYTKPEIAGPGIIPKQTLGPPSLFMVRYQQNLLGLSRSVKKLPTLTMKVVPIGIMERPAFLPFFAFCLAKMATDALLSFTDFIKKKHLCCHKILTRIYETSLE